MNEPATHTTALRIGADHPSLAGHFPGNPIVPGVVLLDHVQQAASRWLGYPLKVSAVSQAKFVQPLLPEQNAHIELRLTGTELRFSIMRGESTLATGVMTVAAASSESRS